MQIVQPQPTGGQRFTEAFNPYLQMAIQMMLQRKMEEGAETRKAQREAEQAQQMFPEAFTADYKTALKQMGKGVEEIGQFDEGTRKKFYEKKYPGKELPSKYKKFDAEKARGVIPAGMTVPLGRGIKYEAPSPPIATWGQGQKVASVSEGLNRKMGTVTKQFGELEAFPIRTLEDAHRFLADKALDPALFSQELSQYEPVDVVDKKGTPGTIPRWQLEDAKKEGFKEIL